MVAFRTWPCDLTSLRDLNRPHFTTYIYFLLSLSTNLTLSLSTSCIFLVYSQIFFDSLQINTLKLIFYCHVNHNLNYCVNLGCNAHMYRHLFQIYVENTCNPQCEGGSVAIFYILDKIVNTFFQFILYFKMI